MYRDLRVTQRFIIPNDDTSWEPDLWGMYLGKSVANIRNTNCFKAHRAELEEMGFY
jgi:hypothetical protein